MRRRVVLAIAALAAALPAAGCSGAPGAVKAASEPRPAAGAAAPAIGVARRIEDFERLDRWSPAPASGVELRLAAGDGRAGGTALRADFDFHGYGGWAAIRGEVPITLPENYELSFWLRGDAPVNTLEFKLIDASGENVWWVRRPEFEFRGGWRRIAFRKRHVEFAWGPAGGGEIREVAAIEFTITAGSGGRGTVWLDDLEVTPLEPVRPYDLTPEATASSTAAGTAPAHVLDGDPATVWRGAEEGEQHLVLDFRRAREYGGVRVDWVRPHRAVDYDVQISADGRRWETIRTVRDGGRDRDWLRLPETESRWLRLVLRRSESGDGYAVRDIAVLPLAWGADANEMFASIAADAPLGRYPRYLRGAQSYWTVVGVDGDEKEALINEQGLLEVDRRSFSIEPFLHLDGRLVTWADARIAQSLERGDLPIPSVRWEAGDVALTVTAWGDGAPGASVLWARYRVENRGAAAREATLYLALRPFQVNPPWQFLNAPGGAAVVREIAFDGARVVVDGANVVVPVTRPAAFGTATFDQGDITWWLSRGALPGASRVRDPVGHASAALAYPLRLAPGESRDVYLAVPWHEASPAVPAALDDAAARELGEASRRAAVAYWSDIVDRVTIELPGEAARIGRTVRSNLAYIRINRDGAAIQPGSRSYERSWIRDGALTSAALLRLGHADAVRAFIEWYAPFQYEDGKVPCCVDRQGAGPVPEHDSHGQLIYLIAEYWRHTGDRALVERFWPNVERAVAYIDSLRSTRRTPEYREPERRVFYGLLPQSISHEGYSAKPMHSYWDDFFALRGLKDATALAAALGKEDARARFAAIRDEFQADLTASIRLAMRIHGIDYIPGAAELGDFDPTSTTVAITPAGAMDDLPAHALRRTFERYWEERTAWREGGDWDAYTPYELRAVGAFVRLGDRRRAHALLDWFFRHQRPAAWNHWAEVVARDRDAPRFLGDMPHTWVGSDFIRSVLDLFAYTRDDDGTLVIGAGVRPEWVTADGGVRIEGLHTPLGAIGYTMRGTAREVVIRFTGDFRAPPAGLALRSPLDRPIRAVRVDGRAHANHDDAWVRLDRVPREVILSY